MLSPDIHLIIYCVLNSGIYMVVGKPCHCSLELISVRQQNRYHFKNTGLPVG